MKPCVKLSLVPPSPNAAWLVPGKLYRLTDKTPLHMDDPADGLKELSRIVQNEVFMLVGFLVPFYGVLHGHEVSAAECMVCSRNHYGLTILWTTEGQECVRVSP